MSISQFLARCDAYRARRNVSDARLSTLLFNDGKKIGLLRAGGDIGVLTLARVEQVLAALESELPDGPSETPCDDAVEPALAQAPAQ